MGLVVLRRPAGREHALTFAERALYHHLHPLKIFTDAATAIIAVDLFWGHLLVPGLIIALAPPLLVSATLIGDVDLAGYRRSPMGAYLRRFMPAWVQVLRLFGVALAFYAAWHHVPAGVVGGVALVCAAWGNGVVRAAASHLRSA